MPCFAKPAASCAIASASSSNRIRSPPVPAGSSSPNSSSSAICASVEPGCAGASSARVRCRRRRSGRDRRRAPSSSASVGASSRRAADLRPAARPSSAGWRARRCLVAGRRRPPRLVASRRLRRGRLRGRLAARPLAGSRTSPSAGSGVGSAPSVGRQLVGPGVLEPPLDDLERQEVLLLLVQDPAQPVDVGAVELPVPRRRPLRVDEPLALEEADLRDRDVGELVAQRRQHLTDREVLGRRRRVGITVRPRPRGRSARTGRPGSRRRPRSRPVSTRSWFT